MNISTYAHTHTNLNVCGLYAGIRNRRSPFHRTTPQKSGSKYMRDIKAIGCEALRHRMRRTQHKKHYHHTTPNMCAARMFLGVRIDLARIGMIAEFSTLKVEIFITMENKSVS